MPRKENIKKVLVIGSGPIIIGQAAEFDYSGSQACRSLREEGVEIVLVNSNPATFQTDVGVADKVYIEPLTLEIVTEIIRKERPDSLLPTQGGQTGLNLAVQLYKTGVLKETGCRVIGTSVESIMRAEERELFFDLMKNISEPIPKSIKASSLEEAKKGAEEIGFPIIIRPGYCLGGTGTGIAYNMVELEQITMRGLDLSMNNEVNLDQCVIGWKEIEFEMVRDSADNCITICSMENVDPMGIHTGDSIVVAPALTLTDHEYQVLRNAAIRIVRALKVEGGCNIQFAVRPDKFDYFVIEVNPRLSRSSALASKATGYPIARVATKIALGLNLDEILNRVTGKTPASFEPTIDYIVCKIPRWPFDKFREANKIIGTQMKATGEVMAIGRMFEEALQKAIRSLDIGRYGLGADGESEPITDAEDLRTKLRKPTDMRIFHIRDAIAMGMGIDEIYDLTKIDRWFLYKIRNIVSMERELRNLSLDSPDVVMVIKEAKKLGFSDLQLAHIFSSDEITIRELRKEKGIKAVYKMVDTCAAEFEARTPYYYSSYEEEDEVVSSDKKKVIILGGGPIRIGQGIEFDYCTVHAVFALKEEGVEAIVINNNPETVSTDFDISDKLYFEPLTFEDVMNVIEREDPCEVMVQFGGQTPINLAEQLSMAGVKILGTSYKSIDLAEDRDKFRRLLDRINIPQAESGTAMSLEEARKIASRINYPVLVRPSYVLGGRAMEVVYDQKELDIYMAEAVRVSPKHPVLIDKFLQPAIELDVDAVSDGENVLIGGIMEHIEHAGVHSGDSACVVPPQSLSDETIQIVKEYTTSLAREIGVKGLMNIQYAVKDKVYVLEVNPRASRTIPFISKAIGMPLAKLAAKVMLGQSLPKTYVGLPPIGHFAVKEVVFPFIKLPGVDPVLGPEMKSTGESMGIDVDFGRAFYKAQLGANMQLPAKGDVFLSVKEEDKNLIVPVAKKLQQMGFDIFATNGTAEALRLEGVRAKEILKVSEGRPNVVDYMKSRKISLVINTPSRKKEAKRDGYVIRRNAVELNIPYITTIAGAQASVEAMEKIGGIKDLTIKSLQEYYGG
ncbi:MAG: carbamoyl-phosphate synthase large subunit [Methanocellales archaeon]|nr:carbamoyl-phosphate synthase large subunit [Methanocellales archaeon]MDD4898321.1 carbamoyl-phosphate synthase large subunit [Methanocellales archaeon]MDD5446313.1 carbamoyl-phosphate synthase large subunit [Methanocellales archaeon]